MLLFIGKKQSNNWLLSFSGSIIWWKGLCTSNPGNKLHSYAEVVSSETDLTNCHYIPHWTDIVLLQRWRNTSCWCLLHRPAGGVSSSLSGNKRLLSINNSNYLNTYFKKYLLELRRSSCVWRKEKKRNVELVGKGSTVSLFFLRV